MSKKLLILALFIFLLPIVIAYDLSDFPKPFVFEGRYNSFIVVGDRYSAKDYFAATDVYNTLGKFENMTKPCQSWIECESRIGSSPMKLATEIDSRELFKEKNTISIGGPCANKITAQIMDLPTTWPECAKGFDNGTGRIIVYNKWNMTQLVVAGYNAEDTKKAAEVLTNYEKYNLTDYSVKVSLDNNGNLIVVNNPFIDKKIIDNFNNQTWVKVYVMLIDKSNITISGSKDERIVLFKKKTEWFENQSNEILSKLPQDEIRNFRHGPNGFTAEITQITFKDLSVDYKVERIISNDPIHVDIGQFIGIVNMSK